jgi:hypothetical protein
MLVWRWLEAHGGAAACSMSPAVVGPEGGRWAPSRLTSTDMGTTLLCLACGCFLLLLSRRNSWPHSSVGSIRRQRRWCSCRCCFCKGAVEKHAEGCSDPSKLHEDLPAFPFGIKPGRWREFFFSHLIALNQARHMLALRKHTAQHSTAQHSTAQHSTAPLSTG